MGHRKIILENLIKYQKKVVYILEILFGRKDISLAHTFLDIMKKTRDKNSLGKHGT